MQPVTMKAALAGAMIIFTLCSGTPSSRRLDGVEHWDEAFTKPHILLEAARVGDLTTTLNCVEHKADLNYVYDGTVESYEYIGSTRPLLARTLARTLCATPRTSSTNCMLWAAVACGQRKRAACFARMALTLAWRIPSTLV